MHVLPFHGIMFCKAKEKEEAKLAEDRKNSKQEKKPGFDGRWYTDINEREWVVMLFLHDRYAHFWRYRQIFSALKYEFIACYDYL